MDIKRFDFDYRIAEVLPMLEDKQLYGTKALIRDLKSVVDKTEEIRTKTIDEFAERLKDSLMHNYRHLLRVDTDGFEWLTTDAVGTHINEIAEEMRGAE